MKKILFTLLLSIFLIPSVNAVEISCSTTSNLLKPNNFLDSRFKVNETSPNNIDLGYFTSGYVGLIPVQPETTYHFQTNFNSSNISPRRLAIEYYDKDYNYISHFNNKITSNQLTYNFTTDANTYYITLHIYNINAEQLNNNKYQLSVSTSTSINEIYEWVDYEECPIIEPEEPDIPVEPDIPDEPVTPDITLEIYIE